MCKSGILPLATFFGRFSASVPCWLGPPFSAPSWGLLGCGLPPRHGCVDFEVLPARPQPPLLLRSAPAWSQSVRTAAILALQHPSFCQARRPAYTPPTSPRSAPAWSPLPPEQPQVTCAAPHTLLLSCRWLMLALAASRCPLLGPSWLRPAAGPRSLFLHGLLRDLLPVLLPCPLLGPPP